MDIYLYEAGELIYDEEIKYVTDKDTLVIPSLTTSNIFILSKNIKLDTNVILKLSSLRINTFIFDPKNNDYSLLSNNYSNGLNTINESKCYLDNNVRLYISKQILLSTFNNMVNVLRYYKIEDNLINKLIDNIDSINDINNLLILEAKIRKRYYSHFNEIINNTDFIFKKRTFHPARDEINVLLSFGNSLLYKDCLINILAVNLNPKIAYLHSSNDRVTSLEYDLSEIYKPLIVDRCIFTCINKKIITKDDFLIKENTIYLKHDAKNKFIEQYHKKLKSSLVINNKRITYNELIKRDCIELKKYVCNKKEELNFYQTKW